MIHLQPIGIVRNGITADQRGTRWQDLVSEIVIDDAWRAMLDGVAEFSHIWVVFFMDRIAAPDAPRVRPMKRADLPRVGIFATRTPARPNPIGIRAVELLEARDNVLRVRGLDALDATPVLDLKPYLARGDALENTRVPAWVTQAWSDSK
ncbi:MAG: tRNA (N6-threonylcarbamoyladenosine(37)-N6)-methyltransferase TrmO [Chloroflexi bacterium]|nr:tRNA (N6-threonylcarbamoyladenosine(37)-N6)-methyltransferase TrmO [Chloroflexota bacterium]